MAVAWQSVESTNINQIGYDGSLESGLTREPSMSIRMCPVRCMLTSWTLTQRVNS